MKLKKQLSYQLMLLPGMLFLLVFSFIPVFGIVLAFQNYYPAQGIMKSQWVGLRNFKFLITLPECRQILLNTIYIAFGKMLLGILVPVCFSLLLNEIGLKFFKKYVQTIVYLPHFLSWAILATVVQGILAFDGPINQILGVFHAEPVLFMASNTWFRPIMILSETWKEFGYGSIIYLAALTGIDPGLYEAASIDGANRWKRLLHITIPGIIPTIILVTTMNLPNILNAGFDQIFNMYNPLVYKTGDIIDTYVYRIGMLQRQYSLSTAVGLIKSVVGMILIILANKLAGKLAHRKIF